MHHLTRSGPAATRPLRPGRLARATPRLAGISAPLATHVVRLRQPRRRELVVDLGRALQPERVQHVPRRVDLDPPPSRGRDLTASTRCPSSHDTRGWKAAKLIRTCHAIRLFSASTSTGPRARTTVNAASYALAHRRLGPGEVPSTSPNDAQVCVWFRAANVRPHRGQVHIAGAAGRCPQAEVV